VRGKLGMAVFMEVVNISLFQEFRKAIEAYEWVIHVWNVLLMHHSWT
jgi:hypothetical protein